jgi:hypothetical protein
MLACVSENTTWQLLFYDKPCPIKSFRPKNKIAILLRTKIVRIAIGATITFMAVLFVVLILLQHLINLKGRKVVYFKETFTKKV